MKQRMVPDLKITVCGMREPENIRAISLLDPDFMGFIFYPGSPRFVSQEDPELFSHVDPQIKKVAVFVNEHPDEIIRIAASYFFGYIQLHGEESPDECQYIRDRGLRVIKAFSIAGSKDLTLTGAYTEHCDYFLFDTAGAGWGGTGRKFNWDMLRSFDSPRPIFLSGGIDKNDAAEIRSLEIKQLFAVDINSMFEVQPGIKQVDDVSYFMKQIKS